MMEVQAEKGPMGLSLSSRLAKVLEAADLHITAMFMEMTEEFGQVGFWRFDPRKKRHTWSGQVYKTIGYKPYEVNIDSISVIDLFHPDDRHVVQSCLEGAVHEGMEFKTEARIKRPDGDMRYVKFAGKPFSNATGQVWEVFGILVDVTDYKTAEEEWRHLAETDELTGAYKLRRYEELLQNEIRRCARSGRNTSVVLIDIDDFKTVNDTHGHMVGNEILQNFVDIVRSCLREIDVIARIGGDEFALLLPETPTYQTLQPLGRIAQKLQDLTIGGTGEPIGISFCTGVAGVSPHSTVADTLRLADSYLYTAKRNGDHRLVSDAGVYNLLRPIQDSQTLNGDVNQKIVS